MILLKSEANIHLRSEPSDEESLLALAVKTENSNLIKVIVDAGATIDMSCIEMIFYKMSRKRFSDETLLAFLKSMFYESQLDQFL